MHFKNLILLCLQLKNEFPAKKNGFFQRQLQGGALYIAVLVSIVTGITLCLFILLARYNQRHITMFTQTAQLHYNLQSAFEIAQSAYFTKEKNNTWIKNTVNDDSIKIKKQQWGAYLIISAVTKNRHRYLSKSGLYGIAMSPDTGLLVADNSRPIGLSGAIILRSNCYLPKAGIQPAYIEGQSYNGDTQNNAFIKTGAYQVPEASETMMTSLQDLQNNADLNTDSITGNLPLFFSRSFANKTVSWQTAPARLSGMHLENNIKIICGDIEIDSSCHLQNILIICNKVRFKENFKGKVHVIARDSIICEKKCEFNYPSSFVLLPGHESSEGLLYIQFNEDCKFTGGILALNTQGSNQKVFIKLHARSEVNGFLYSSGYLHLEGTVNATAICNKLMLKTPSAVYENHILGCSIDAGKYAHLLAVPSLFKPYSKLLCCANMN